MQKKATIFTLSKIVICLFIVFSYANSIPQSYWKSKNAKINSQPSMYRQKPIQKYEIKISDESGSIIYPFTKKQKQQILQCGAVSSIKSKQMRIMFIQSNSAFKVTVSAKDSGQIKVSGIAQSIPSQQTGKHVAMILVNRQCNNYFSSQKYLTVFTIYPKSNETLNKDNSQKDINKFELSIPSLTYCLEQIELLSLQQAFDIGYIILWAIIASMMPSFPLGNISNRLICLFFILLSQLQFQFIFKHIFQPIFFTVVVCANLRQKNIPVQHQPTAKLSRNCFISLLLCFLVSFMIGNLVQPTTHIQNQKPSVLYVTSLYIRTIVEMLIIFHSFACIVWFNRVRSLFWWLLIVIIAVSVSTFIYPQLIQNNSRFFGILLPSIFAQSCKYRSLFFMLLMVPVCQYIDRFNKVKFGGLMIMLTIAIFGVFSSFAAILFSIVWVIGWFGLSILHQNYYSVFTRTWLAVGDMQNLAR